MSPQQDQAHRHFPVLVFLAPRPLPPAPGILRDSTGEAKVGLGLIDPECPSAASTSVSSGIWDQRTQDGVLCSLEVIILPMHLACPASADQSPGFSLNSILLPPATCFMP